MCLVRETGCEGGVGVPAEDGGGVSPCEPGPGAWDLAKLEGGAISLCSLGHQGVQCVSVTQVGQKCLPVDRSA